MISNFHVQFFLKVGIISVIESELHIQMNWRIIRLFLLCCKIKISVHKGRLKKKNEKK